jgi:hypothetical protein
MSYLITQGLYIKLTYSVKPIENCAINNLKTAAKSISFAYISQQLLANDHYFSLVYLLSVKVTVINKTCKNVSVLLSII